MPTPSMQARPPRAESKHRLTLVLLALPLLAGLAWLALRETGRNPVRPATSTQSSESIDRGSDADTLGDEAVTRTAVPRESGRGPVARLRGRVLDHRGEPLIGALVGQLAAPRPASTTAGGEFELAIERAEATGPITLLVLAAGHAPLVSEHDAPPPPATNDLGDLQLLVGGGLHGRITGPGGTGVRDATVTLRPRSQSPWPWWVDFDAVQAPASSDADGFYALAHLLPGDYRLTAQAAGLQADRSQTVLVVDGVDTEVAPITLQVGFPLTGVVLAPDGQPVAAADVHVRGQRNQPRYDERVATSAEGRFRLDSLPPGPVRIEVLAPGFLAYDRSDVDASRGRELIVRLEAGLRVTGTVVEARSGRPVEAFAAGIRLVGEVAPTSNGTMAQQLQRHLDALRAPPGDAVEPKARAQRERIAAELQSRLERVQRRVPPLSIAARSDVGPVAERPSGQFSFDGLAEGLYSVSIVSPDHQSARIEPVEVRRGIPPPDLRVELAEGYTVRGVVEWQHDGTRVAGAIVELVSVLETAPDVARERENPRRSLYPWFFARSGPQGVAARAERTGDDGGFEFGQAAPGQYVLSVRHTAAADHQTEPFYIPSGRQEIRVEVGRRAVLTGTVLGVAVGAAEAIEVVVAGGHGTLRTGRVHADGTYRLEGLQPGSYLVRAFRSDSDRYVNRLLASIFPLHAGAVDPARIPRRDVTLLEGETRTFDLALDADPTGAVRGTVTINGQPRQGGRAILRPAPGTAPGSPLALRASFGDLGEFAINDVPVGEYTLGLYAPSGQELSSELVDVAPGSTATVTVDLEAGGLRGRVRTTDATPPDELRGNVWMLPGATEAPADVLVYRRTARVHRIRIRDGSFQDDGLPPGPALLVVELRGRPRVTREVVITVGGTLDLDLTVSALRR